MPDAIDACKRLGFMTKGRKRERRKGMMPMRAIIAFALFSSRR